MKKIILSVVMVFAFASMTMYAQTPAKKSEAKTEQKTDPCKGCKGGCSVEAKEKCHDSSAKKDACKKADCKKDATKKSDVKKKEAKSDSSKTSKKTTSSCCSK